MPARHSPSILVVHRGRRRSACDPFRTVVWVRGEHDIATRVRLSAAIARAGRLDDADVIVDLSGVTVMDASTIGVLVSAHEDFRTQTRSLSVRAPSPLARRLLGVCGLTRLIDGHPVPVPPPAATALGTWVEVPTRERDPVIAEPLTTNPTHSEESDHGVTPPPAQQTGSDQHLRALP